MTRNWYIRSVRYDLTDYSKGTSPTDSVLGYYRTNDSTAGVVDNSYKDDDIDSNEQCYDWSRIPGRQVKVDSHPTSDPWLTFHSLRQTLNL